MHFGLGGRQCIGKTIAMTNIYKLASTLLREFKFDLVVAENATMGGEKAARERTLGKMPDLISVSVSDLEHPLMVRVCRRTAA
jgi:cytochrome P450